MRACLIVDDSPTVRLAIASAVRSARKGIEHVHEAANVDQALQMLNEHKPEIVFLDMMLGGDGARDENGQSAEGLTVLRRILDLKPDTHVVVITGLPSSQPDVVDAISLGAIAALRKPVKADDIRYVLESIQPEKGGVDYFA